VKTVKLTGILPISLMLGNGPSLLFGKFQSMPASKR